MKIRKLFIAVSFIILLSTTAFGAASVTVSITAQNTWSNAISPVDLVAEARGLLESWKAGKLNISISGTWVATVTLQRSFDGVIWLDVTTWTANAEQSMNDPESGVTYRIGVATGNFTSGTVILRLSR